MNKKLPINYYSWEIITQDIAIKYSDISVFKHHGSGIPKQSRWFWEVENLKYPNKAYFTINYAGGQYKAYIEIDINGSTRLFWYQDLSHLFNKVCDLDQGVLPCLRFERIERNLFNVSFIDIKDIGNEANDNFESEVYDTAGNAEGRRLARYTTKYERNSRNRLNAIKIHGTKCKACGFDFEKVYGAYGKNFIEVHHIKPLYDLEQEEIIDPKTDLVCLCSNCHRMIHRKRDSILTIEQLKQIIIPFKYERKEY